MKRRGFLKTLALVPGLGFVAAKAQDKERPDWLHDGYERFTVEEPETIDPAEYEWRQVAGFEVHPDLTKRSIEFQNRLAQNILKHNAFFRSLK